MNNTVHSADEEQVEAYAKALGVTPLRVQRRPASQSGISALAWGEDPALVFLHGAQLNAHTWDGVLLHSGVPALAYDLPGHGQSARMRPEDYTVSGIAEAVINQLGRDAAKPFVLVGHSFGAMVAVVIAARRPSWVQALVLLDATPHGIGTADDDPETLLVGTLDELVESVQERVPRRTRESILRGVRLNASERTDGLWEWCWDPAFKATSSRRRGEREAVWADVRRLPGPVVLVRGERSGKVSAEMVREFVAAAPRTTVLTAPGAGHNIHTEAPAWTAALLKSVVSRAAV